MAAHHIPVMLTEVLEYLHPQPGQKFIDGTLGAAGYTLALADAVGPEGRIISFDLDGPAILRAQEEIARRNLHNIILVQDNFKNLAEHLDAYFSSEQEFDGAVFDLGLSSDQLADEQRGFSFQGERPLDMAFGGLVGSSTERIINESPLLELTRIFREYGEERHAYQIAKAVVAARRLKRLISTADLVAVIDRVVPPRHYQKIHPATRIFQALRIATNDELGNLSQVLPQVAKRLKISGRLAVVSFHSGEDRIVKRFFKDASRPVSWRVLTKRPLLPTEEEIAANSRARSAKLRVAQKILSPSSR